MMGAGVVQGGVGALAVSENQTEEGEGGLLHNLGVAWGEAGLSSQGASVDLREEKKSVRTHTA